MVGQISVFPDVGGAFFGSYRQARSQRLQEAAMRAEMAAAQADRQRQAQARESFARLQGPDQVMGADRVGQTIGLMGSRMREMGIDAPDIGAPTQRVVREGMTPEQRAREEQRLAQADPDAFMSYRQSQAQQGPEARDYSPLMEALPQQLEAAQSPEEAQRIAGRSFNVARGYGYQGSFEDYINETQALYVPQSAEPGFEVVNVGGTQMQRGPDGRLYSMPGTPTSMDRAVSALVQSQQGAVQENPPSNANNWPSGSIVTAREAYGGDENVPAGVDPNAVLQAESQAGGRGNNWRVMDIGTDDSVSAQEGTLALNYYTRDLDQQRQIRAVSEAMNIVDENGNLATGIGSLLSAIPGTPAAQLNSYWEGLVARGVFGQMDQLRQRAAEEGARGTGLGQITEREIALLQRASTLVDQRLPPERFQEEATRLLTELQILRDERQRILQAEEPDIYNEVQRLQGLYDERLTTNRGQRAPSPSDAPPPPPPGFELEQ